MSTPILEEPARTHNDAHSSRRRTHSTFEREEPDNSLL